MKTERGVQISKGNTGASGPAIAVGPDQGDGLGFDTVDRSPVEGREMELVDPKQGLNHQNYRDANVGGILRDKETERES